jgi:hypothetical protein
MSDATQWGWSSIWHHRVLGGLWALCGCALIVDMVLIGRWAESGFWLASAVALLYVFTGIGFMRGRKWARRTMAALMVVAGLFFLDMLLMFGFHADRAGMLAMLVSLGAVAYTLGFLLISAAWHAQDSV